MMAASACAGEFFAHQFSCAVEQDHATCARPIHFAFPDSIGSRPWPKPWHQSIRTPLRINLSSAHTIKRGSERKGYIASTSASRAPRSCFLTRAKGGITLRIRARYGAPRLTQGGIMAKTIARAVNVVHLRNSTHCSQRGSRSRQERRQPRSRRMWRRRVPGVRPTRSGTLKHVTR